MRSVQITEAKAKLSGLLAEVEAGETIKIMRRGRVIARLVPERSGMAADAFRPFWEARDEIALADLVLSPVVLGELELGVEKSAHREKTPALTIFLRSTS